MRKKYIIIATLLCSLSFSSCDMEKYPYNSIEESKYMKQISDFRNARYGLYSPFRAVTTGGHVLLPEIQGDDFNAVAGFSNNYGNQYQWDFQSTDGNIESVWSNYYSMIAVANFYIKSYENALKDEAAGYSEEDLKEIATYAGEAYFVRAYSYYQLAVAFCKPYNKETAETDLGLPLQLTYAPTSDASKYPGRSSMKDTYERITADISKADELITGFYEFNTTGADNEIAYIRKDVVTALKARVALQFGDYDTAIDASTNLINSGNYPLASTQGEFEQLWAKDNGSETIWMIEMSSPNELGAATGTIFRGQYRKGEEDSQVMDYIPSQKLIDLYDKDNDIRFKSYFLDYNLKTTTGASGQIYVFNKYPGNTDLNLSVDDYYTNKSKPFRNAEMYLIASEAYLMKNDMVNSAKYLNELRKARIVGYVDESYSNPNTLLSDIQDERHKELVGEGFRIADLKRWNLSMDRENKPQNASLVYNFGSSTTTAMAKDATDTRFTWPIPKSEMDVNPQLAGQQNPGY